MRTSHLGRVGFRIAAPVSILAVILAGLLAWILSYEAGQSSTTTFDSYANLLSRVTMSHLRDAMLAEDRPRLQEEISRIAELEPIREVRIVDKSGLVVFDSDPAAVGVKLPITDPSCQACHADGGKTHVQEQTMTAFTEGRQIVRALHTIVVEAECVACHERPEGSALGVLVTDLDVGAITGGLEERTGLVVILAMSMTLLVILVMIWSIRRLVVARVRHLRRMLDRLRSGARSAPLTHGSRDEIDDLARSLEGFVLDLDEQLALQGTAGILGGVIDSHPAPVLLLDPEHRVVACNRTARSRPRAHPGESIIGRLRQECDSHRPDLLEEAGAQGWAVPPEDGEGPAILALRDRRDELFCYFEVWAAAPTDDLREATGEFGDHETHRGGEDREWLIYAATIVDRIRMGVAKSRPPVRGADRRLTRALRLVSELAWSVGSIHGRTEVELGAIGVLALQDIQQAYPKIRWHTLFDPAVSVPGVRYQIRELALRLLDAAARGSTYLGDALVFTQLHESGEKVFLSAWTSTPGGAAILDPGGLPPLAAAIARAHGGGVEVDPRFDIRKLAEFRGLRLSCDPVGTLYVAELSCGELS